MYLRVAGSTACFSLVLGLPQPILVVYRWLVTSLFRFRCIFDITIRQSVCVSVLNILLVLFTLEITLIFANFHFKPSGTYIHLTAVMVRLQCKNIEIRKTWNTERDLGVTFHERIDFSNRWRRQFACDTSWILMIHWMSLGTLCSEIPICRTLNLTFPTNN